MPSDPLPLSDVIALARPIVERVIWCTVSTVSSTGEPRSRLMHPVWSWDEAGPVALVTARPTPIKVRHLAANPRVACHYWDPAHDTVSIDATATWIEPHHRAAAWDAIASTPPPVGFDPSTIWPDGPTSPDCAVLRLDAVRIVATPAGRAGARWRHPGAASGAPRERSRS